MRKTLRGLDAAFEYLGIVFLGAIVLIVTWAVVARAISGAQQEWTVQVPIALMIWMVALGTAIGFRERSHASVDVVVEKFSEGVRTWVLRFTYVLVLAFGVFLIVRGVQLTVEAEAGARAVYAAMPVSGFMTCVYATLQLMGVQTQGSAVKDGEGGTATGNVDE